MDVSQITENLFIGTTPEPADDNRLRELGVTLVINMRFERRPYPDSHNPPMQRLWLPTFDTPLIPIPMGALRKGVRAALGAMDAGGKVFVHCAAGVHRSVAQAAAILIAQGSMMPEAVALIKTQRTVADPDIWYIRRRIEKFARSVLAFLFLVRFRHAKRYYPRTRNNR